MKILRLSIFNIKKSKKEALAVAFLAMISALFLGLVVTNVRRMNVAFSDSFERSKSYNSVVFFPSQKYREDCRNILLNEYGVEDTVKINALLTLGVSIKDKSGDKYGVNMCLVTPTSERKVEDFAMVEAVSEAELASASHPIWLPTYFKLNRGFELSDDFVMGMNGREYPFTIVGFYEAGMMASDSSTIKCVICEEDYRLLEPISDRYTLLYFDYEDFPFLDYANMCDDYTLENISSDMMTDSADIEKLSESQFLQMFLVFVSFFSLITLASAMFLIRHKIGNDIEDQMQQIGVLEALGYRSREISLSYVFEYLLTGGLGAIAGGLITILLTPVFNKVISVMLGRHCVSGADVPLVVVVSLAVILLLIIFATSKAGLVKKYPPVVAFRRGIKTHHFRRNYLPLDRAKGNVNICIALKDFVSELRTSIGVLVCIMIAAVAILFCVSGAFFFRNGYRALVACMGSEVSEVTVLLEDGTDIDRINEEISQMPQVRKTLLSYGSFTIHAKVMGADTAGTIVALEDYKKTENIMLTDGRFPEYDNEVMVSVGWREREGYQVGDSIVLQEDGAKTKYIITGIVSGMLNGGSAIYMNFDGLKRLNPYARPDTINIYLEDGVDKDQFQSQLALCYGESTNGTTESIGLSDDDELSARIAARADEIMAVLKTQYGVTDVEYAVIIGDEIITGNSSKFTIRNISSIIDLAKGQIESVANISRVFTLVAALLVAGIVAVILSIISSATVRRKKKDIGIMKSLGYSSKDLMTQMAVRIMPPAIVGVGLASVLAYYIYKAFWLVTFSLEIEPVAWVLVATDMALIGFCYLVTYISAGRIKKISVTELMTE